MKKVLFLIHDLGQGGAEKVLVNLANNLDLEKYDVTIMSLFDHGENRESIQQGIKYRFWCPFIFPGNSHLMKLLTPQALHNLIIKEHYDIEVSYLEGPCARVISGCTDPFVKLVSWIHTEFMSKEMASQSFRSYCEAKECYGRFDRIVCVSETVREGFKKIFHVNVPVVVLYNTNENKEIVRKAQEEVTNFSFPADKIKFALVGKLTENKGFDRVLRIGKKLLDQDYPIQIYILGDGPLKDSFARYIIENGMQESAFILGYQGNPYKYIKNCNLFICSSFREGFSTAATEALILGVPVITTEVSGMKEMLGKDNEYGVIVPNSEEALYLEIKNLLDHPELLEHYRKQALLRSQKFTKEETVKAVQEMLSSL